MLTADVLGQALVSVPNSSWIPFLKFNAHSMYLYVLWQEHRGTNKMKMWSFPSFVLNPLENEPYCVLNNPIRLFIWYTFTSKYFFFLLSSSSVLPRCSKHLRASVKVHIDLCTHALQTQLPLLYLHFFPVSYKLIQMWSFHYQNFTSVIT